MNKQQIIATVGSDPRINQAVDAAEQNLGGKPDSKKAVSVLIELLEKALKKPEVYPAIREKLLSSGKVDPANFPEQFDQTAITSILAVLYLLEQRLSARGYARGGLALAAERVRKAGRRGDTMLAHITPQEAAMLRRAGGSGTKNPQTGLPEFFLDDIFEGIGDAVSGIGDALGDVAKYAVPIATMFVAPYLAPYLGGSMLAAGALTGALGAGLTGGNVLQGALMGGLGQGLGGAVGGYLAPGLSAGAQGVLGNALVGGLGAAVTGGNPLQGAVMGGLGTYAGQALQGLGGAGAFGTGLNTAGTQFGNMLAAGYRPGEAIAGAGLAGLATGLQVGTRPAEAAVQQARTGSPSIYDLSTPGAQSPGTPGFESTDLGGGLEVGASTGLKAPAGALQPTPAAAGNSWLNPQTLMAGASLLGSLASAPPQVQQALSAMSPEQKEYFNRPNISWDWNALQRDAAAAGQPLSQYMAQNWNTVTAGKYNQPTQPRLARGGALNQVANLARGAGSGRADTIDARLSDGEYVMDAETVALLGDGSTNEGARKLDDMRRQVRMHKGKSLARGQFSRNAKSPLSYLKEAR